MSNSMCDKLVHEILHGETCKEPSAVAELCIEYAKGYADDEPLASALLTRAAEVIIAHILAAAPSAGAQEGR